MTDEIMTHQISFKRFLLKNGQNKTIIWVAGVAIVTQFVVFKYFYPFASYIHGDSFSYINAAEKNLDISTYLIGYSKFLRLFSVFNRMDYALAAFQYLFIQCSALYLLSTLFYFYSPGKVTKLILLGFILFNPLFLHLGNLISSDGFFLALSLIWFALLLWIIHQPSIKIFIWHSVILFIAFTVRYNAMIYPVIAVLAFSLSSISFKRKIAGVSVAAVLIGSFVFFTMYKYKKLTEHWQYSPFSGWQLTNNAMYAYRYVETANRKPVPPKFEGIHNMITKYFDSTKDVKKFPIEAVQASTFYMWSPGLPMMKYRDSFYKKDTTSKDLKKWASMGPLFKDYGLFIIKQYPWHYARYFLWPNLKKYYAPPVEFLEYYNSDKGEVTEQAQKWFGYTSRKVVTRMKDSEVRTLNFYPILSGIINMTIVCCLICYLMLRGWKYRNTFKYPVLMVGAFWLLNAGFTIVASSAALRFQSFPVILTTIFAILLVDWLVFVMKSIKKQESKINIKFSNLDDTSHQVSMHNI